MKNIKSPNNEQLKKINLERTKKFFVFLVVFLFAVFALIVLQGQKESFDKAQNAPFIIISDDDTASEKNAADLYVRPIKVGELAAEIERSFDKEIEPVQKTEEQRNPEEQRKYEEQRKQEEQRKKLIKQAKVIQESVAEIQYQHFGNDVELINALNAEILRRKESQLKLDENSLDKSLKAAHDFEEKKEAASKELDAIIKSGSSKIFDIKILLKDLTSDSPLYTTLIGESRYPKKTPYLPDELKTIVTNFYEERIVVQNDVINKTKERIGNTGQDYQLIIKSIYTTLKVEKKLDTIAPPQTHKELKQILDEKGSLNVIYKFAWITLTAVIIFSLLYLILIPLKYIYSLTGAGEAINKQNEKLLEPKASASTVAASVVGNSAARAAIVTIAAVGIGTAALASANPFASAPAGKNGDESNVPEAAINTNRRTFSRNSKGGNSLSNPESNVNQLSINELTATINSLKTNVSDLQARIATMTLREGDIINKPNFITSGQDYTGELNSLRSAIISTQNLIRDPQNPNKLFTVFGNLNEVSRKFEDKIDKTIGKWNDLNPTNPQTIFGNLTAVSNKIGTPPKIVTQPPTTPDKFSTVFDEIGNVSKTLGTQQNKAGDGTLIGDLKEISGKTATIDTTTKTISAITTDIRNTTTDIRVNQFGRDGKNILTQFRILGSPEHYQVTQPVYDALEKAIGNTSPSLLIGLKALIGEKEMSDGELFKKLREKQPNKPNISKEDLKKWRKLIIRYTRVPH